MDAPLVVARLTFTNWRSISRGNSFSRKVRGRHSVKIHFHGGVEHILLYGVSAIIVIDVLGLVAGRMVASNQPYVSQVGKALGAIVPFKG